ncbi:MAG: helix-turn-helix domain-containing protein [Chloroflexi bacterium]|nr:helix-turn-helix domain-containing protein [Chloroflexota bacterium]
MKEELLELDLIGKLLKAAEVAEFLNISRAFAYQLMNRGELRTVAIGTARRVRPEDLRRYIQENIEISSN